MEKAKKKAPARETKKKASQTTAAARKKLAKKAARKGAKTALASIARKKAAKKRPAARGKAAPKKRPAARAKAAPKKRSTSRLTRPLQRMTTAVRTALQSHGVLAAYRARPPYQRNDYLSWIAGAVSPANKAKRVETMIHDLRDGALYMGMKWAAGRNAAKKKASRSGKT